MNTQEKLEAIKAKCHELLALAEKRTQGKWEDDGTGSLWTPWDKLSPEGYEGEHITLGKFKPEDLAYISACAGAAEAGWRATKEECEDLLPILRSSENMDEVDALTSYARGRVISLCIAWPEELLAGAPR